MSTLQQELVNMTNGLSDDTMRLLLGMMERLIIPLDEKSRRAEKEGEKKLASERIGFMEGMEVMAEGYDFDEYNPEIAKLFGVVG